jgi:hypothetical protein
MFCKPAQIFLRAAFLADGITLQGVGWVEARWTRNVQEAPRSRPAAAENLTLPLLPEDEVRGGRGEFGFVLSHPSKARMGHPLCAGWMRGLKSPQ